MTTTAIRVSHAGIRGHRKATAAVLPIASTRSRSHFTAGQLLIFAYLAITRVGFLPAAKLGVRVYSVPLFLTDLVLLGLLLAVFFSRTNEVVRWILLSTGAGVVGQAVWALCALAIVYFAYAVTTYGVLAARDLAIFGYSLFFPLSYICLDSKKAARNALWVLIYSGFLSAVLLLLQAYLGADIGLGGETRFLRGQVAEYVGSGDVGGIVAFSAAGLASYAAFSGRKRLVHLLLAATCLAALAVVATRAAVFGLCLCGVAMLATVESRHRHRFVLLACVLLLVGVSVALLPEDIAGVARLHKFYLAVGSAMGGANDGNAAFRLSRWQYVIDLWSQRPLLGIGFGEALYPSWLISPNEAVGEFNVGMPHNTYLMILARLGIVGLTPILFSLFSTLASLYSSGPAREVRDPDSMAAANVLICMTGFAGFVLFFERPMHGAAFWIMLAVAYRFACPTTTRQLSIERRAPPARRPFLGERRYSEIRAANAALKIHP